VATKEQVEKLKRRHSRRLLRLPGVSGVGIERAEGADDYALVVHVEDDNPHTLAAVQEEVPDPAVRVVRSGKFKKL
jgi:hypothetical protein